MDIGKVSGVSFGRRYSSILKTEYLRGNLPVSKGLYGGKLTPTTVSLEHILPKSGTRINGKFVKGHTNLSNLALATRRNNSIRGNKPLKDFLTRQQADEYLSQFKGVKTPNGFNGDKYIEKVSKTIDRLLK